jgi:2-amino-4-hydroxy-6-hydroxymethyldihydropteridine diphosphokinase
VTWVTLGLGSNHDAESNLQACLDSLLLQFRDMKLSCVYESAAEPAGQGTYLNMAVGFETDLPLSDLQALCKRMEAKQGRNEAARSAGRVSLDIDILTYGNQHGTFGGVTLPRAQVLTEAYVLWPLSQVAPQLRHTDGIPYARHWKEFTGERAGIRPVDFTWHGRRLSTAQR